MAEEEVDIDLNDPDVGKAAVKIQAGFKNYMARKKEPKDDAKAEAEKAEEEKNKEIEEGIADIDLNDPDMEKAATKIQATFRGYKTRKETGGAIEAK